MFDGSRPVAGRFARQVLPVNILSVSNAPAKEKGISADFRIER